jgi:predicted permease
MSHKQPDTTRAGFGSALLDLVTRDLRIALRAIRNAPGYALTVILTLALGIGASATIFSIVDHVLVRPLGYPDADRLVTLLQSGKTGNQRLVSYPTLQDWAASGAGFTGMAWIRGTGLTMDREEGPRRVVAGYVSPGFFKIMGQAPALGRTFTPEEEAAGGPDVIVISHDFWQKAFGGDPQIIGKTLRLDSTSAEVIGVMAKGFGYPPWAESWRPLGRLAGRDRVLTSREFHVDSRAIARLAPGVDTKRATQLLSQVQKRVSETYPEAEADWTTASVSPLRDEIVGNVKSALLALGGAVALILLVACVNLANLAAVRGSSRGREVAIRLALGASRARVVRHLATESFVMAILGGSLGIVLATRAVAWLRVTAPFGLPRADEIALDVRAVAVASTITVVTAVLFGVFPALRAALGGGSPFALLVGRGSGGGSRREARGRALLTGAQFALALVLLVGAGLLAQSYRRVLAAQLGFDPHNVFSIAIEPPKQYGEATAAVDLYQRVLERLRREPGVDQAAVVNFLPSGNAGVFTRIEIPGRPANSQDVAIYVTASEAYLKTLGIPLVRGRWFTEQEMRTPGDGIVISETVAKRYWPDQNALGKPLTIFRSSQARAGFGQPVSSVVIGVVADVKQFGPESQPQPAVYVPISAEPWAWVSFAVRVREVGGATPAALRRAVLEVEPKLLPLRADTGLEFNAVENALSGALAPRRYLLGLVGGFSTCALLLAAFGVYGVASYAVSRRTQEFGIRLALGATVDEIVRSVIRWGIQLAVSGCVVGLIVAFGLARLIRSLLFNTSPTDVTVLVVVPLLLIVIGAVAVYLPARRASRVDPIVALRNE